jgi:DNA helicase II / ATP-dependent DNA helicase PcrA
MNPEFDRLVKELNPEQLKAVTAPEGSLLILAGAGSGKTRILTLRIAELIGRGVPNFQILGVTFTNKAANEMKYRVSQLVSGEVWVSTFHSTCLRILRMNGERMGLQRNFTIYDDHDQLVLIKECLSELGKSNDREVNPKGVREEIARAKDFLLTPKEYAERAEEIFESVVVKVFELYEKKLAELNACDFGDLILKTVFLFDQHADVLKAWQDRFRHILIDEYQDTNHAQYRFVRLLADRDKNITVVGDPDQSIYAWRGADIRNILNFEQDYPSCQVIKLEQNYRSTANILEGANHLIEHNMSRKPKSLWTEKDEGEKISLFEATDEKEEAEFLVRDIKELAQEGKRLSDFVVFYRLHAQSRVIEEALRRANVPYQIIGGIRFYDRREIKDLIAYLRCVAFSHDQLSFRRIANVPHRGIGKKSMQSFQAFQSAQNLAWDETLSRVREIPGIGARAKESLFHVGRIFRSLRAQKSSVTVSELLEEVLKSIGYLKALEAERTMEAKIRLDNIQEFFSAIQDFEENWEPIVDGQTNGIGARKNGKSFEGMLEAFLESISLTTDLDSWDGGSNSLTLMTLHTAKGLEFPHVYMVGVEEEVFPHVNAFDGEGHELEEERRLCYVGMTRAKEKLTLIYANSRRLYGFRSHNLPSRFLNEIPPHLYAETGRLSSHLEEETVLLDPEEVQVKRRILFD